MLNKFKDLVKINNSYWITPLLKNFDYIRLLGYYFIILAISFEKRNDERFNSLKDLIGIKERIFKYNEQPNINLLKKKLNINKLRINDLTYYY